ncbi:MAG: 16S rRNA (uracil(1498)-N(3))-methyltransferase [Bacteroidota bacterium]|nr:16S rRNA (uracil(1498)-N(3))-methyltransferase [Bacteroidota bacterium]
MRVNSLPWQYNRPLGRVGDILRLEGDEWHHCNVVLRLRVDELLILTDGWGLCMVGQIREAEPKKGQIELIEDVSTVFHNPRSYRLSVAFAPTKSMDRTEMAIEKLTELGVDEITFLDCHHGERDRIRMDRIEKIMTGAAKQSRKSRFPLLKDKMTPGKYISELRSMNPDLLILACHQDPESRPIFENYSGGQDVVLLVGPEGGFSEDEIKAMLEASVKLTSLGPFRLRVETAVIKACSDIHLLNEMKYTL